MGFKREIALNEDGDLIPTTSMLSSATAAILRDPLGLIGSYLVFRPGLANGSSASLSGR